MRYAENHQYEGGSENKYAAEIKRAAYAQFPCSCLHLFVARHTKSQEAVQMFRKSFDKYFMATVENVYSGRHSETV